MARTALRWTVDQVAEQSDISWAMAQKLDRAEDVPKVKDEVLTKVKDVFEKAGIVFEDETDTQFASIRKRKPN